MPAKRKEANRSKADSDTHQRKELKVSDPGDSTVDSKPLGSTPKPPLSAIAARRAAREAAAIAVAEREAATAATATAAAIAATDADRKDADIRPDNPTKLIKPEVLASSLPESADEGLEEQEFQSAASEWDEMQDPTQAENFAAKAYTIEANMIGDIKLSSDKKQTKHGRLDPTAVSNFSPSADNVILVKINNEAHLCIGLRNNENLSFCGQILLAPLFGAVSLMGSVLSSCQPVPSSLTHGTCNLAFYPVFSPKTHSLLTIEAATYDKNSVRTGPINGSVNVGLLAPMARQLQEFTAIFVIRSLAWCGLEDVENVIPLFKDVLGVIKKDKNDEVILPDINSIRGFQPVLKPTRGVKILEISNTWSSNVNLLLDNEKELNQPSVSVVCGNKNMGKSTFSRYLVNRLLNSHARVAYLETDIGQCEFTPSGLASLHVLDQPILGPPFTHQHLRPNRCYFLGSTSPKEDPHYYMDCVTELVKVWRFEFAHQDPPVPLVINTNGWIKGLGYDLLLNTIAVAKPTDVFVLHSRESSSRNLPANFESAIAPPSKEISLEHTPTIRLLDCASIPKGYFMERYNPTDLRVLSIVSYLHQETNAMGKMDSVWWNFSSLMVDRIPWTLNWQHGLNGVWVLYEDVAPNHLLYSLNGSIVGLLGDVVDNKEMNGPSRQQDKDNEMSLSDTLIPPTYYSSLEYPPPPPHRTTCHGLALIRAVDPTRHAFLLLTPLPLQVLKKVSGIVKGNIDLPVWCMLDHRLGGGSGIAGVPWRQVPYTTLDMIEGVGAAALKVRRNLMRRVQQPN